MSLPTLKKLLVDFSIKSILIVAIIVGGVVLVRYTSNNTRYFRYKQQRIDRLLDLSNALQLTQDAYLYFTQGDSTQVDSLKVRLQALAARKAVFSLFDSQESVLSIKQAVEKEEAFYTVVLAKNEQKALISKPAPDIAANAQPMLTRFIKQKRYELKIRVLKNEKIYEGLGYLVITVGALLSIMNIFFYYRSKKGWLMQMARDKEIYKAKLAAQAANNAKSEYLAMISHEIRTPMNGVLGMSNLLMQGPLDDDQRIYAKTIYNSAESLLRIVNDVLDFSKIEAGKIHLDKTSVNIRTLVEEAFAVLPITTSKLDISYHIDEHVPEFIYCDPLRLKQILLNFFSNALKFTEEGEIYVACKVLDKDENGTMRLGFMIKDTGIGIAKDRIKLLFKPFVQESQSTARKYGGTGLGLNIAYKLITMMGGKIKVKSEVGKGSTFTFFVVVKEAVKTGKELPSFNTCQLDSELCTNYPFNILAVDDNEINLLLISKTLEKLGYDCKTSTNGKAAVELVKQEHFDLIFMDMQMPIMDGTVATTEIRKHYGIYEYPVVIALTANTIADGRDRCLEAGMQDFISKPFKPVEIEAIIKKWAVKILDYQHKHQSKYLS
jgi:signal transduction histidine kinase/ActR/RegA family two-component response regulator